MNFEEISISSKFDRSNRKRGWENEKCNKQRDERGREMKLKRRI